MVEYDQEDEEDPYSNIGIPPTTMAPTAPIVNEPLTVSTQSLRRNSSVVMLSDDEKILIKSKKLINTCNQFLLKCQHQ